MAANNHASPIKDDDDDTATAVAKCNGRAAEFAPCDPEEEQRLVRQVDRLILPLIAVCYAFFYIDKTALSYAAIFGLEEDLQLVGTQYAWLPSAFYLGFLAWALPTSLMLQRYPLARYLGINIFIWGVLRMAQAASAGCSALLALRVLSGAAEACADPAFMLINSMWYTRREQPLRIGIWYLANGLGIALGGLLGYVIGNIRSSLASWKYEFVIIGALCSAWGIVLFVMLPSSPVTARYFGERERHILIHRLKVNQTGIENKLYIFLVVDLVANEPNGGISTFGTLIIQGFGFPRLHTTLLQIPYDTTIAFSILVGVFLNDRFVTRHNTRCYFIVLFLLPNIAGAFGLRFAPLDQRVVRLICYYLTGPYNAAFVMVLSLTTANVSGHTKKVVLSAALFIGYAMGNTIEPFFFTSEQAPTYDLGIWSMIFCHLSEVALILALRVLLARENKRRDQRFAAMGVPSVEAAFADLTDWDNPNFRCIY